MPITISLAQHLYANLTTAQSPTRRRGYQTLAYTRDRLSTASVKAIEARMQHYPARGSNSKWQFYGLPGGQTVISFFNGVPEPDEFGRTGRYLVHSIVIDPRDWDYIGSSPFELMIPNRFCQKMDQALALGNLKTGELEATTVEIAPYDSQRAIALSEQWAPEELWKLARLVYHTQGILDRGHFVCFVGNASQLKTTLEVALHLTPAPRTRCTFDTSSSGCNWSRQLKFWAQGVATEREARVPFVVLAEQKKVRLPNDWSPPETPYEKDLKLHLENRTISRFFQHQSSVQRMSAALLGQPDGPLPAGLILETVKTNFARANRELLEQRIDELLKELPKFLRDMVDSRIGSELGTRLNWLLENPAGEGIAEFLFEVLGDWKEATGPETKRSLTRYINEHSGVKLIFGLWEGDRRAIQSSLSAMDSAEYRRFVLKLSYRPWANPQDFFNAKHLELWLDIFHGRRNLDHLTAGISFVVTYGAQSELDQLLLLSEAIHSIEDRKAMIKWLEKQAFRKQLKSLTAALKESLGVESSNQAESAVSRLARRFRRSS